MNIKILVVAPYEGMREVFKQVSSMYENYSIDIVVGNLEEGLSFVKKRGEENYDVIISRGGTAELIQKNVSVPVVDIQVSGYDMLRVLKMVSGFPGKAAIVGFSNISRGASTVCSLLELDLLNITIQSGVEVRGVLQRLAAEGFELVIGDVVTVNTAKEMGLTGILITSGVEAVVESLEKAEKTYRHFVSFKTELDLYKTILKDTVQPIIIMDHTGKIIFQSDAAKKFVRMINAEKLINIKEQSGASSIATENGVINYDSKFVQVGEYPFSVLTFQENENNHDEIVGITFENIQAIPSLTGQSSVITHVRKQIESFSQDLRPILVEGENGTGKKLLASIVHKQGLSSHLQFMTVDCSLVPIEKWSKVVDHVINNASTIGTVYFKSIDSLELVVQSELLRLEEICEKVRIISSSINNIREKVKIGKFRPDLYTLISRISIYIPPITERLEDIEPLTHMFISHMHSTHSTHVIGVKKEGIEILQTYSWPGNVKELKQVIEQLILQANGYYIEKEDIEQLLNHFKKKSIGANCNIDLQGTLDEIEKQIILRILEEEEMNQSRAAKRLGINRSTLWRKLK